ncbi:cytochrome c oxidase subunit II [Phycisphaerales bacterium]|nr:cytochrome c oxidase subunit II [Phycisphaerales bacterium]
MHTGLFQNASTTLADGFWRDLWLRSPSPTENGRETDSMFMFLWWFCVAWFVLLMALMVYWVIKYRRRPGTDAVQSPSHNTPLEVIWTVVPSLMLVYIFFRGFWGYIDKIVSPGDAVEMQVIGSKWSWDLRYPNGMQSPMTDKIGFNDIPVFYMPAKTNIRLKMQSSDVLHAFWVPDFRIKQDVVPNRYMTVWFNAEGPKDGDPGTKKHPSVVAGSEEAKKHPELLVLSGKPYTQHYVFCAEYCGQQHSEMAALIRVVSEDVYKDWLEKIGTPSDPIELGKRVFKTKCASCHTLDGSRSTGPSWLDMYGRTETLTDGTTVVVDDAYILESIFEPAKKIVKTYENGNMTSFRGLVSPDQVQGLIAFMKSISQHAPKTEVPAGGTPAEAPKTETPPTK